MNELRKFSSLADQTPTVKDPEVVIDGLVAVVMRGSAEVDGGGSAQVTEWPGGSLVTEKPISDLVSDRPVSGGLVEEHLVEADLDEDAAQ